MTTRSEWIADVELLREHVHHDDIEAAWMVRCLENEHEFPGLLVQELGSRPPSETGSKECPHCESNAVALVEIEPDWKQDVLDEVLDEETLEELLEEAEDDE